MLLTPKHLGDFGSRQPKTFTKGLEWLVQIACVVSLIVAVVHTTTRNRFDEIARRYDSLRLWKPEQPTVSDRVKSLQARLERDFDRLEYGQQPQWVKTIWQTWRNDRLEYWKSTWTNMNPEWNYEFMLDSASDTVIRQTFKAVPDVIAIWDACAFKPVLRADLYRYLMLYARGGLYADVDTTCTKPVDQWLTPAMWQDPAIHAVVAVNFNDERHGKQNWYRYFEFAQHLMMARQFSPLVRRASILAITRIHRLVEQEQKQNVSEVEWSTSQVLKTTGPICFTDAALSVMGEAAQLDDAGVWREVYGGSKPRVVGGVAVLPVDDWRPVGGNTPSKYFKHHGQGSWL